MNLAELKIKVEEAIEYAKECSEDPKNIDVSLQIDGPETISNFTREVELHYDNNFYASGCVLLGYIGEE